jgi:hypothetical protein
MQFMKEAFLLLRTLIAQPIKSKKTNSRVDFHINLHKHLMIFLKKAIKPFVLLCFPCLGFASSPGSHHITNVEPWFTGPLLTPGANVVPKGHYNIQPYLFFTNTYGQYNAHWKKASVPHLFTGSLVLDIQFGLSRVCDFEFNPLRGHLEICEYLLDFN